MRTALVAVILAAFITTGATAGSKDSRISSYGTACQTLSIVMVCETGPFKVTYSHDGLFVWQHTASVGDAGKTLFRRQLMIDTGVENTNGYVVPPHSIYNFGVVCSLNAAIKGITCQLVDHSWLHFTINKHKIVVLNATGAVVFSRVLS